MKHALPFFLAVFFCFSTLPALALEIADLKELEGFTLLSTTKVSGEFEGADPDKSVTLDNGMIFKLSGYSYSYSFRPSVAVFAKTLSPEEMARIGVKEVPTTSVTLYSLIIKDRIYTAYRVR